MVVDNMRRIFTITVLLLVFCLSNNISYAQSFGTLGKTQLNDGIGSAKIIELFNQNTSYQMSNPRRAQKLDNEFGQAYASISKDRKIIIFHWVNDKGYVVGARMIFERGMFANVDNVVNLFKSFVESSANIEKFTKDEYERFKNKGLDGIASSKQQVGSFYLPRNNRWYHLTAKDNPSSPDKYELWLMASNEHPETW